MSMVRDFFRGVVDGFIDGATNRMRTMSSGHGERGRIERLCRELGWSVDEREGNAVRLHFNSASGGVRKVSIANGDNSLVGFSTNSDAILPANRVPPDLLGYLLHRNLDDGGSIGMWGILVHDDNEAVTFHLSYMALGDGLDAQALKYICESLSREASDFDLKLHKAGLLD